MKNDTFAKLLGSVNEALEHSQGKRELRTTVIPLPPPPLDGRAVKRVRATLRASQAVFASYLNVSTKLVQAWEGNRRKPEGAALVLLHIAAHQPSVLEAIRHEPERRVALRRSSPRHARARAALG